MMWPTPSALSPHPLFSPILFPTPTAAPSPQSTESLNSFIFRFSTLSVFSSLPRISSQLHLSSSWLGTFDFVCRDLGIELDGK
ncbi:hypothetical protein I3760_03G242100 [Carya illinoinensis]|nr:hypothetical protein I3760_03G242100 [Carya illinoinensis]